MWLGMRLDMWSGMWLGMCLDSAWTCRAFQRALGVDRQWQFGAGWEAPPFAALRDEWEASGGTRALASAAAVLHVALCNGEQESAQVYAQVYRRVYRHVCRYVYRHVCRHVYRYVYRHGCRHVYRYVHRHVRDGEQQSVQVYRLVYRHVYTCA